MAGEDTLALTITPPLMKMNMNPGDIITTAVKIVNNNDRKITVYAKVLDFRGKEDGGVEFIENRENFEDTAQEKIFLSQWITIKDEPIEISAFKYKNIPFVISVPEGASPGGHYAAVLVGTKPPEETGGTVIRVSSYLSSLILVSIAGEIEEKGAIREFSSSKRFYKEPKVDFKVRFQNQGNVHLQPVGAIKIYNIFGKEKGSIPINYKTDFGNVLPGDERKWDFSWDGDDDVLVIDRFRAELNLSFGEEARQNDHREIYFWVVNVKLLLIIIGIILFVLLLLIFFIKFYISQSVKNIRKEMGREAEPIRKEPLKRVSREPLKKASKEEASSKKKKTRGQKKKTEKIIDLRKIKK